MHLVENRSQEVESIGKEEVKKEIGDQSRDQCHDHDHYLASSDSFSISCLLGRMRCLFRFLEVVVMQVMIEKKSVRLNVVTFVQLSLRKW